MRRWILGNKIDVINTHSSTDSWLVGLATHFMPGGPAKVRTRHISAPIPKNMPTRWLYTRSADHIVTTGETLRHSMIVDNRFPGEMITSIPTGIDTNRFVPGEKNESRKRLGLPLDIPIIGIVATLRSWKGHKYLVDAFAKLPSGKYFLLIVGDGPQKENIRVQLAELNLESNVMMAGNQQDVVPWLQAMDLFVLPSYANEGVPQGIMQAMSCELPVISTPIGSISEAVQDGVTGILVSPKDAEQLYKAMVKIIENKTLREDMGLEARRYAQSNFALKIMGDKMEGLFYSVLGHH